MTLNKFSKSTYLRNNYKKLIYSYKIQIRFILIEEKNLVRKKWLKF